MKIKYYEMTTVSGKYVAFWGGIFSNWYPCHFKYDGFVWSSSEQCFMALKAKYFGDEEIYEEIKANGDNPKEAKKLGRKVKGFDSAKWDEVKEQMMYDACFAKFSQNERLKKFIFDPEFEGKHFVEGSPVDRIWGCGVYWCDDIVHDEKAWTGLNLLGKTLDKVRENLKEDESR